MAIKLVTLPPTELGATLNTNDIGDIRVVYRPSEENPELYVYHDLWDQELDYPDGYVAVPFKSIYGGYDTYKAGTVFANVIGSKNDPKPINPRDPTRKPYTSWRQLMRNCIHNYDTCCAERNKIYLSNGDKAVDGFECTNQGLEKPDADYKQGIWMHGAHVMMGETETKPVPEGDTVYMLPLCENHNTYVLDFTKQFGEGYYMKLGRDQEVITLNKYLKLGMIQNAILKEELEMKNLRTTEKPQLSVGLEFTFMGVDLSAYYTKKQTGYQIFVAPMNVDNKAEISLSEMIDQFNKLAGAGTLSEEDVKKKIESEDTNAVGIDWGAIRFCLKMLFLNIDSEADTKTTEYALSLQIIAEDLIPKEITVFNVKSLSFNIWNTQRQNVLDRMSLTNPEAF